MHAEEFLKEVLDSPLCPENFETIYREFQQYQQLAMNTLNEFHRVCEKNGVSYQLAYGSLLGAIRDDGMIPWDYDVDVWVPYCEVPALISALQKDLSEDYYFHCREVDPKCRNYLLRLAPKGYNSDSLHVDVFYMIGVPEIEAERKAFIKETQVVSNKRYYKLVHVFDTYRGYPNRWIRWAKMYRRKLLCAFVSVDKLNRQFDSLTNKYPFNDAEYCMSFSVDASVFVKDILWDTKLITNPCGEFRVTKNYDKFLQQMYGDYKRIFPLQNRLGEMMNHYRCLKKDAKKK